MWRIRGKTERGLMRGCALWPRSAPGSYAEQAHLSESPPFPRLAPTPVARCVTGPRTGSGLGSGNSGDPPELIQSLRFAAQTSGSNAEVLGGRAASENGEVVVVWSRLIFEGCWGVFQSLSLLLINFSLLRSGLVIVYWSVPGVMYGEGQQWSHSVKYFFFDNSLFLLTWYICVINTLPGQKKVSRFKSADCSVLIWGCFSCSGLGTRVPECTECTEWPGYPINGVQDDNGKTHWALVVKEWSMNTHECQGAWGVIFTYELATTEFWL